jgi:amino acid transporter
MPRHFQIAATVALILFGVGLGVFAQFKEVDAQVSAVTVDFGFERIPDFLSAIALSVFLFMGFEWVTPLGRSPAAYRRLIPFSMLASIVILMVMYASIATGLNHVYPGQAFDDVPPHLKLGADLLGKAGVALAVGLSLLAMLTSFNAGMMGASRMIYGMARERILPKQLANINLNTGAPWSAIVLVGTLSLVGAGMMFVEGLAVSAAAVVAAIASFTYGFLVWAAIVVGRRLDRQGKNRSHFVPYPVQCLCGLLMPLLGIAAFLSVDRLVDSILMLGGICLVGLAVLVATRGNQEQLA